MPAPSTATAPDDEPSKPAYGRVLLKLSGESLCKEGQFGIDGENLQLIAGEITRAMKTGAEVAVVVGGGNIIRGAQLAEAGHIDRAIADQMGMLGTV
ncbi:MAG: UMP kinase, partial [Planctomycetota bacterium]